jgi:5-methylcytosine-specific restriction endonuclease McrA
LPATFTLEQWRACLEYWNGCCAVCGKQLRDLFGNVEPHADHWLPLSKGGGSEAKNMICLCSECNMNKHDAMPNEWLTQKFGQRRAKAISENVKKYFTQFD